MIAASEADEAWWPADLQPVARFADVVGVMDGPAREPENFLLQFAEDLQFRGLKCLFLPCESVPAGL
jgi:hypothetical protein